MKQHICNSKMAKSKVNKKSKSPKAASKQPKEQDKNERLVTMEALAEGASSDDEMPPEEEWNKEARALREAIAGGAYDHLLKDADKNKDDDSIEEVELGDNDDENDEDSEDDAEEEKEEIEDGDDASEADESEAGEEMGDLKKLVADGASDSEEEDDEEEEEEEDDSPERRNIVSHKALSVVTEELAGVTNSMPWAEKIFIIPPTPLPFGLEDGASGTPLDIHDDLKREVAFYDMALEAVVEARVKCKQSGILFSRPEDFFAEMVKTDDHMAMVKDRLIFENKKIDAVAQRKSNKEQKLRSKESVQNKVAEKLKRKKDHFKELDDWAQSAASNRGLNGKDEGGDKVFNKKRQAADKKYGHGGKKGRFKQSSSESKQDVSGFNPRGNFAGGQKKTAGGGSGGARQGKRARDAGRSRK